MPENRSVSDYRAIFGYVYPNADGDVGGHSFPWRVGW